MRAEGYLTMVCSLSGPMEMMRMGVSNCSSRKSTYALKGAGNCSSDVIFDGAEAVEKSYPGFFEDLQVLGGRFDVL